MRMPLAPCRMGSMMHAARVLLSLFSSSCLHAQFLHDYVHAICALKDGLYDACCLCPAVPILLYFCLHTNCVM